LIFFNIIVLFAGWLTVHVVLFCSVGDFAVLFVPLHNYDFILIIISSILAIGLVKPQVISLPLIAIIVIGVTLPGLIIPVLVPV